MKVWICRNILRDLPCVLEPPVLSPVCTHRFPHNKRVGCPADDEDGDLGIWCPSCVEVEDTPELRARCKGWELRGMIGFRR